MLTVSTRSVLSIAGLLGLVIASPIHIRSHTTRTSVIHPRDYAIDTCGGSPVASGQAIVNNTCAFTVYLQSVDGSPTDTLVTLQPGNTYKENYHLGPGGAGVAIKMTNNESDWLTPMLLEYTPNFSSQQVFYDMSVSVGGHEDGDGGIGLNYQLTPSDIDGNCVVVGYANSYVHLGETDYETKSCPMSTSLTLSLC